MRTRFDGLAEFLSRRGRMKLLQILKDRGLSYNEIAQHLDVNRSTAYRWFYNPRKHPGNETTDRIISLVESFAPKALKTVLTEEIAEFEELTNERLNAKKIVVLHGGTTSKTQHSAR